MKKSLNILQRTVSLLILFAILAVPVPHAQAQEVDVATLTMEALGGEEIVMVGPYDTNGLRFSLPVNWFLMDGAELQLKASSFFIGPADSPRAASERLGATLNVYFNGDLQQSVQLLSGNDIVYSIPLQVRSLPSPRPDGTVEVSFFLNAAIDCEQDFHKTTVLISSESQFVLPYTTIPLATDLRKLPWPFYQPGLREQTEAVVVIPSAPTVEEVRAGLLVMAGFGRMTDQRLPISMITADELTPLLRDEMNLVFVGGAGKFTDLADVDLPIQVDNSRYVAPDIQDDDGVLQVIPSPWNPARAMLVVGGNSNNGIVKAAQAFTTQNLQTGDTPTSIVIAEVNPVSQIGIVVDQTRQISKTDISFGELGYGVNTSTQLGVNWYTYDFNIPPGQISVDQPYIDLVFSHSALVDFERSGIGIYLNGDLVGSAIFEETNTNFVTARINLPASGFVSGYNVIDVTGTLIPRDICSVFSTNGLWMSVFPDSVLHLPLVTAPEAGYELKDLRDFPQPFTNNPNLTNTMFVVPSDDPHAWTTAGRLAYTLGDLAGGSLLGLEAAFGEDLASIQIPGRNLILVGKPSLLPAVSQLGDALPARFEPNSNEALLENQQVIYRFSSEKSLGYLELLTTPWDSASTILAVLGTTDDGLTYAGDALLTARVRDALRGNFATLDQDRPSVVDTRTGQGLGRMPVEMAPAIIGQETPVPASDAPVADTSPVEDNRGGILFAIQIIAGLMAVVVVLAFIFRKRRSSPPRQ
jgi:cellulose synthase operon protein B